jgi:hypothetical protein
MQVIHPELFGDLGDQILAADLCFGIRRTVDDCPDRLQRNGTAAIDIPELEYFSSAEPIEELNGVHDDLTQLAILIRNGVLCSNPAREKD